MEFIPLCATKQYADEKIERIRVRMNDLDILTFSNKYYFI